MGIKEYIVANERVHQGEKPVKYIFCDGWGSDKLVVNFPGFSNPGQPPQYNYIRTLNKCKCHRLYILDDYGPRGSYLIGENRDHSIEGSVVDLIFDICSEYDIKPKNVILHGSSKGGYCALYFGIKYKFGYAIAGAPQTLLGDYLSTFPEITEYIAGGTGEDSKKYLNDLLFDLLLAPSEDFPEIFIHIGKGDHHYEGHIIPFVEKLDDLGVKYHVHLANFHTHALIGRYYQGYLLKTLNEIDPDIIEIEQSCVDNIVIEAVDGFLRVNCESEKNLEYAFNLYKGNKMIEKVDFQSNPYLNHKIDSPGNYHAIIKVIGADIFDTILTDEIVVNYSDTYVYLENYEKFKSKNFVVRNLISFYQMMLPPFRKLLNKFKDNSNYLKIDQDSPNRYIFKIRKPEVGEEYAWYILKDGERVDTVWYDSNPELIYTFTEPGNYQIKYFIKKGEIKKMKISPHIIKISDQNIFQT